MRIFMVILISCYLPTISQASNDDLYSQDDIKTFKDACDKGGLAGCNEIGTVEVKNGNIAEAKRLFKKACASGGYIVGCNNLGTIERQLGNKATAKKLFKMSCDAQNMTGCFKLGALEAELKNYSSARKLLNKSCDNGQNEACNLLKELTALRK